MIKSVFLRIHFLVHSAFCTAVNANFKISLNSNGISLVDRSPLFGHFSTTLLGLPTIRAFRVQNRFVDFYNRYQDEHTKSWFSFIGSAGWLSFRLEVLSTLFISFVVFISIALRDKLGLSAGEVGLMLAYTINITGVFQQCVRHHTEVENQMTSVERVLEYCDLESEESPGFDAKPPNDWPQRGCVRFEHVSFAYDQGLPKVLSDIDCCINSTEKVNNLFKTCDLLKLKPHHIVSIFGIGQHKTHALT